MGQRRRRAARDVHGIVLLDKAAGISSNKALQQVRGLFGARKAGHTGSLDPLATGMLPVCLGEATKFSGLLLDADKGYETELQLGVTTDSLDADGDILQTRPVPGDLDRARLVEVSRRFVGEIAQVPPMVSAIRVDGKRLYELARAGQTVERQARQVTIHSLDVLSLAGDRARLRVHCSKGTYIRSLVGDIGEALGCGAHVTALRRLWVAPFQAGTLHTLESLQARLAAASGIPPDAQPGMPAADRAVLDEVLLPVDAGLGHLPRILLESEQAARFCRGQAATAPQGADVRDLPDAASLRVYGPSGLLGLGEWDLVGCIHPRRVLQWS